MFVSNPFCENVHLLNFINFGDICKFGNNGNQTPQTLEGSGPGGGRPLRVDGEGRDAGGVGRPAPGERLGAVADNDLRDKKPATVPWWGGGSGGFTGAKLKST